MESLLYLDILKWSLTKETAQLEKTGCPALINSSWIAPVPSKVGANSSSLEESLSLCRESSLKNYGSIICAQESQMG